MRKLTSEVVNKRIASRGIRLIGDYVGSKTKTNFECSEGHQWEAEPDSVMSGCGCPQCVGCSPLSKVIVNERIASRGIRLIGDYVDTQTKTTFECREGHQWDSAPSSVMRMERGCPHCSGRATLSKDVVNKRIASRGIRLIGDYVDTQTKTTFECREGHQWSTRPNNVMSGRGCPQCSGRRGFNPLKSALLYFLEITHPSLSSPVFKIGITNNDVKNRISGMNPNIDTVISVVDRITFDKGQEAYVMEQHLKQKYKHLLYDGGRDLIGNGHTELFTHNIWEMEKND